MTDARDREWGLEGVLGLLRAHGGEVLPALLERIVDGARAPGPQRDDQTLLLARVLEAAPGRPSRA